MADAPVMAGKSVLVTGGTSGIGKATAAGLAALGARVGITGRDPARTEAVAASIRATPGSPVVDGFAADMSAQAGVRRLAAQVLDTYPRLDVLVNNAGGFWAHRHVTADGLEHTFALNHLAPFLLTSLLLDRLAASAPARGCPPSRPGRRKPRFPGVRCPVFGSLDYIYLPVADVDGEALRYVQVLGAELVWKVRGMGTTVACLRAGEHGPAIALGHLQGPGAILVYRVQDYAATVAHLRARHIAVRELEIPHGPCATFTMEAGQRYAVYQLVRPDAVHQFDGRIDP